MMPVKEILAKKTTLPQPPVLVIDESVIRKTADAGPVCGCHEKYELIQKYKPFLPGGVNPYNRRKIPDVDCFDVQWINIRVGSFDLIFEKPVAKHQSELPDNYNQSKSNNDDLMFVQLPRFSKEYVEEKLRDPYRKHVLGCNCSSR